jgi:hypothetical protein
VLWRWTYDGIASIVGATGDNGAAKKKTGPLTLPTEDAGDTEEEGDESAGGGKADKKKKIPFGDAHLMATALGADINALIHRYQILEGKSDVQLLSADQRAERVADFGERRADGSPPPLIDVLPRGDLEKQRLEGFLYSGVAQDSGDRPARPGPTVQQGFGDEFGTPSKVIREKRKGYRKK